ncbi:MAG TPA: hypothetical protein VK669_08055 [Candidatus Limnocylindrales bacterium]|nr:hypothetical protein [Candidatus Limnocylindrales bacterium]
MTDDSRDRFRAVQAHFAELAQYFPDGFAAIGGFAVWLHSARLEDAEREGTDDGDAMLTRHDFEELKSLHAVEDNERLGKHQFRADGIEFDLYVEYEKNDIRVPVTEVLSRSVVIDGIRAASLEDLLVMKLDAALGREGSRHGRKDDRDIAKIVMLLEDPDERVLARSARRISRRSTASAPTRTSSATLRAVTHLSARSCTTGSRTGGQRRPTAFGRSGGATTTAQARDHERPVFGSRDRNRARTLPRGGNSLRHRRRAGVYGALAGRRRIVVAGTAGHTTAGLLRRRDGPAARRSRGSPTHPADSSGGSRLL